MKKIISKFKDIDLDDASYIIATLLAIILALIFALIAEIYATSILNANSFTAFIIFIIAFLFSIAIIILYCTLFPTIYELIGKGIKSTLELLLRKKKIKEPDNSNKNLNNIRNKDELSIALEYTSFIFKDYMDHNEIEKLSSYIQMYNNQIEFTEQISPIRLNSNATKLYNYDLSNYGYNLWSYIKVNRVPLKTTMGNFLKYVFKEQYQEAEETSITKNLGSDMADATIKIDKGLKNFIEIQKKNT